MSISLDSTNNPPNDSYSTKKVQTKMNDQSQLAEMIRGMKVLQAGIGQKIRSGNLVFFI